MLGEVVKLDRGYPLVKAEDGNYYRCEHATALIKGTKTRAVIGDKVEINIPDSHDKALIEKINPRSNVFIRKDPTERALPQVLAANFEKVIIVQPINELNLRRLERELVLAYETKASVAVILTKTDLLNEQEALEVEQSVKNIVGNIPVLKVSLDKPSSFEAVFELVPPEVTAILIGRSGVGKSSLVNALIGEEIQETQAVRETDGKGRHTTVSREIIQLPHAGRVVDMPGVRGLGLWDAREGIALAFSDVEEYAQHCKFRDCRHENEPGCAVLQAIEENKIPKERFESYKFLLNELQTIDQKREEARRLSKKGRRPRF